MIYNFFHSYSNETNIHLETINESRRMGMSLHARCAENYVRCLVTYVQLRGTPRDIAGGHERAVRKKISLIILYVNLRVF